MVNIWARVITPGLVYEPARFISEHEPFRVEDTRGNLLAQIADATITVRPSERPNGAPLRRWLVDGFVDGVAQTWLVVEATCGCGGTRTRDVMPVDVEELAAAGA